MKNLKTLALAATPGPWMLLSVGDDDKNIAVCDEMGVSLLTVRSEGDVNFAAVYEDADAAYIAAASPDAILALLADLEKHRALMVEHLAVIDPLRAERDRLREALKAMADDGWLLHGSEGPSDAQKLVLQALEGT